MTWQARIDTTLRARKASHSLRRRVVCTPAAGGALVHQGVRYRNFSGNDYLGLSQHPALIAAWGQGAETFGVGSGASGHVSGYSGAHQSLENALAQWLGFDRALLFISGFAANQAVVAALMQQPDRILADRLSHASLLEAASHSPATLRRFAHNAPGALAALLGKPCDGLTLVFTEGVFSMDGDRAPLADIAGEWPSPSSRARAAFPQASARRRFHRRSAAEWRSANRQASAVAATRPRETARCCAQAARVSRRPRG